MNSRNQNRNRSQCRSRSQCQNKTSQSSSQMSITSRITNSRRHTTGYVIGGKVHTVAAAVQMARSGRLRNVQVVGDHIQSVPGAKRLSDLPIRVQ